MRGESQVALTIHENPDSDAVGAAAGMLDLFAKLGVAVLLRTDPGVELPLADEFLPAGLVAEGPPPAGATLYALDCGSAERLAVTLGSWPSPRQHAVRASQSRRCHGEQRLADRLRDRCRAGPAVLAHGGRGALCRYLVRHRPLPALQHLGGHLRLLCPARL
jgi:hypothetical protein